MWLDVSPFPLVEVITVAALSLPCITSSAVDMKLESVHKVKAREAALEESGQLKAKGCCGTDSTAPDCSGTDPVYTGHPGYRREQCGRLPLQGSCFALESVCSAARTSQNIRDVRSGRVKVN